MAALLAMAGPAMAYTWESYGGHQYALTDTNGDWTACETEAVAAGGHLVTINDAAENAWILTTFISTPTDRWIGLYQLSGSTEPDQGFVWISGDSCAYRNWATNEPNNAGGAETYVEMFANFGTWNDRGNDGPWQGIIEKPAPVPAPPALLLLASGLAGLAVWRRRRG